MRAKGVRNPDVAEATGVHVNTVSQWLSGRFPPSDEKLDALVKLLGVSKAWLRYGDNGAEVARNQKPLFPSSVEEEFSGPTIAQKNRVWLEELLLELTEHGADDDFIAWARRFMLSPQNYALYADGSRRDMTDEQVTAHMQGLAVGVRAILKDRLKKGGGRNEKARG